MVSTGANGQRAFGGYVWEAERERFVAHEILVLTLEGARIAAITAFLSAEPFERFGLPAALDA
jgi:RNA polymerase sigma-70 factor, ECF subfamily